MRVALVTVSIEASGKNMEAVCKAKEVHNRTCPWGGQATEVHLAFFDIERIGWEEGEVICGLTGVGAQAGGTGVGRVTGGGPPGGGACPGTPSRTTATRRRKRPRRSSTPSPTASWSPPRRETKAMKPLRPTPIIRP